VSRRFREVSADSVRGRAPECTGRRPRSHSVSHSAVSSRDDHRNDPPIESQGSASAVLGRSGGVASPRLHVWAGAEVLELSLSRLLSASRFPDPHVQEPGQYQAKRFSLRLAALVKVSATTGQPGRQGIAAQQRHHLSAGRVGLRSRFASDVAMETPTGRCSGRGDDTSSRPRSRSERRPCPRRNAPRRRRADTAPRSIELSATPCHILASGVPLLLSMDPTEMH
jgi:hypothetical protein